MEEFPFPYQREQIYQYLYVIKCKSVENTAHSSFFTTRPPIGIRDRVFSLVSLAKCSSANQYWHG
jgi:hypothetical protein